MNKRDDQRAQALNYLKLASATFALRLDAFEAREVSATKTNAEPSKLGSPDIGFAKQATEPMRKSPCPID